MHNYPLTFILTKHESVEDSKGGVCGAFVWSWRFLGKDSAVGKILGSSYYNLTIINNLLRAGKSFAFQFFLIGVLTKWEEQIELLANNTLNHDITPSHEFLIDSSI